MPPLGVHTTCSLYTVPSVFDCALHVRARGAGQVRAAEKRRGYPEPSRLTHRAVARQLVRECSTARVMRACIMLLMVVWCGCAHGSRLTRLHANACKRVPRITHGPRLIKRLPHLITWQVHTPVRQLPVPPECCEKYLFLVIWGSPHADGASSLVCGCGLVQLLIIALPPYDRRTTNPCFF